MRPTPVLSKYDTTDHLVMWLPFPPSVNHYWGTRILRTKTGNGGFQQKYINDAGKKFRQDVLEYCLIKNIRARFVGPLQVTMDLLPPITATRDADNYSKSVLDALTHAGLWDDDSQVIRPRPVMWSKQVVNGKVRSGTRIEIRTLFDVPFDFVDWEA